MTLLDNLRVSHDADKEDEPVSYSMVLLTDI